MKQWAAIILAVMAAVTITADDFTTNDGVTYLGAQVVQTTPLGIKILVSGHYHWIDFRDLPADVAAKYGYNPDQLQNFENDLQVNGGSELAADAVPDVPPVNTDTAETPPTVDNTYVASADSPIVFPEVGVSYSYVFWNGHYYPWGPWNSWYWNHHWVNHNGRYYPAPVYYNHGVNYNNKHYPVDNYCHNGQWQNGQYYSYHPNQFHNPDYNGGNYSHPQQSNLYHANSGYHSYNSSHAYGGSHGGRR